MDLFVVGVIILKKTSIFLLILFIGIMGVVSGCNAQEPNAEHSEQRRIDLYVEVMKSDFEKENGGNDFIAIRLDTLEGLSSESKDIILENLKDISQNVYDFEDVKNDESKFKFDGEHLQGAINGSILSIDLDEYKDKSAKITGVSWFGNVGAVFNALGKNAFLGKEYQNSDKGKEYQRSLIFLGCSWAFLGTIYYAVYGGKDSASFYIWLAVYLYATIEKRRLEYA